MQIDQTNSMAASGTQAEALLDPWQVAVKWNVTTRTVQRWIADGRMRAIRTPGGRLKIKVSDSLTFATHATDATNATQEKQSPCENKISCD